MKGRLSHTNSQTKIKEIGLYYCIISIIWIKLILYVWFDLGIMVGVGPFIQGFANSYSTREFLDMVIVHRMQNQCIDSIPYMLVFYVNCLFYYTPLNTKKIQMNVIFRVFPPPHTHSLEYKRAFCFSLFKT